MTGNNDCPYRKNIECSYRGALIFCRRCGFYPVEERRRKTVIESNIGNIEQKRPKNIMQLIIVHKGKKVSYSVQAVRKRTASPKTNNQSKINRAWAKTRPETRPD